MASRNDKSAQSDRIQRRLGNSGGGIGAATTLSGSPDNPRRTYHNIHHGGTSQRSQTWTPDRMIDGQAGPDSNKGWPRPGQGQ
jgi:hypothetical protein